MFQLNSKPTKPEDKKKKQVDNSAIKGDYKLHKEDLHFKDLVKKLETWYNIYNENGMSIALPKDARLSYFDQAAGIKKVLDYIQRQAN